MKPNLPKSKKLIFRVYDDSQRKKKKRENETERDRATLERVIEGVAASLKMIAESS